MNAKTLLFSDSDPVSLEWAQALGGFFRNFGMIELLTIELTARMADAHKAKSLRKKFLNQRLNWIVDNVHERTSSGAEKVEALIEALEGIRELAPFRNVLAHGALGLSLPEDGEAAAIAGILNFKPEDGDKEEELIPLEAVREKAAESAALARILADSLNAMAFEKQEPPPEY
jgi:hypothetical protein